MGESFARGDVLVDLGTPLIDSTLDLCPNNVGGMKVPLGFRANFAATQSAVAMKALGATNTGYVVPKAGSIIGLSVLLDAAMNASDKPITFQVFKNATGAATVVLTQPAQKGYKMVNKDVVAVAAGDVITVKMTNSTIASSALNAQGLVLLEF